MMMVVRDVEDIKEAGIQGVKLQTQSGYADL